MHFDGRCFTVGNTCVGAAVEAGRFRLVAVGLVAVGLGAAPAIGQIVFSDQTMSASDYATVQFAGGLGGSASVVTQASGGNPGSFAVVRLTVAGGTPPLPFGGSWIWLAAFGSGAVVDPRAVGGIASVSASADSRWVSGTLQAVQNNGVALRQGGRVYYADLDFTSVGGWTSSVRTGLSATSFRLIVNADGVFTDSTQHPDFSPNGIPIELGFIRGNSNGPNGGFTGYSNNVGIDNWTVTVMPCGLAARVSPEVEQVCPGGATSIATTATGVGELTLRWQWREIGNSAFRDVVAGANGSGPGLPVRFLASGSGGMRLDLSDLGGLAALEFRCVVTNACGSVTSNSATLTIATPCSIADVCPIGGPAPGACPDGLLTGDDFNAFISAFAAGEPLADVVSIGGSPPGDGLITGDDFNAFIAAFAGGCP